MINSENYVDEAENVIKDLKNNARSEDDVVSISQLRNILAMTANLYDEVRLLPDEELPKGIKERISYLRMRCVYEAGRTLSVKNFIKKSELIEIIKNIKTKSDYINFSHYMESLVAWRKYPCGKDE